MNEEQYGYLICSKFDEYDRWGVDYVCGASLDYVNGMKPVWIGGDIRIALRFATTEDAKQFMQLYDCQGDITPANGRGIPVLDWVLNPRKGIDVPSKLCRDCQFFAVGDIIWGDQVSDPTCLHLSNDRQSPDGWPLSHKRGNPRSCGHSGKFWTPKISQDAKS